MWRASVGALVVSIVCGGAACAQPLLRLDVAAERTKSWLASDQGKARLEAAVSVLHDRMGVALEPAEISARIVELADSGRAAEAVHVLHRWSVAPSLPDAPARLHLERCSACSAVAFGEEPAPSCGALRIPDSYTREQPMRERVARLSRVAFEGLPLEALDLDDDGVLESIAADLDGDGLLDCCRVDLTGDGIADLEMHFESGEWRLRRAAPWEALGPAGPLDAFRCSEILPASIFDGTRERYFD
jgi:hypothetical protein